MAPRFLSLSLVRLTLMPASVLEQVAWPIWATTEDATRGLVWHRHVLGPLPERATGVFAHPSRSLVCRVDADVGLQ